MHKIPERHPSNSRTMADESDIGSGEKTAGQLDTEQIINAIPALPACSKDATDRTAQEAEKEAQRVAAASAASGASGHDTAAHGQLQGEQNASRQQANRT